MKIKDLLIHTKKILEQANITTARLDSLILLEDATGKDRSWLLGHQEHELDKSIVQKLNEQIKRRSKHEPLAYIRGKSEFYGREFKVNSHTLQPRPETETMIDLLKQVVASRQSLVASDRNQRTGSNLQETSDRRQATIATIADIGTGSGCIAITAKLIYPEISVVATDIDKNCLSAAIQNAKQHNAEIDFHQGNLLDPFISSGAGFTYVESEADFFLSSGVRRMSDTTHEQRKGKSGSDPQANSRVAGSAGKQVVGDTWILLANLPYVPNSHTINKAAMHEPAHAIFGGDDGLKYYRKLFKQAETITPRPTAILTEALPPQHSKLELIAGKSGYQLQERQDFIQVFTSLA